MHKLNIIYYEGFANRDLKIRMAKLRGENPFRPVSVHAEAGYPIVPRPGDRIYFPLDPQDAKYYSTEDRDGVPYLGAVVQWVELNNGSEDLYVVATDEGHKGRGTYEGDYHADVKKALEDWG